MKKTSALVLAATILLAGCGGAKPDPSPTSINPASPTATTPPTTSVPTSPSTSPGTIGPSIDPNIPAAARAHTPAGAEAFVRYYFERLNVAWTAPRAGILSPLCQVSAVACTGFEKDATRLAKEGHRYDGNPVTIKFIGVLDATNPKNFDVLANVVQERTSEIDAAGKIYVTDARKDLRFHVVLLPTGNAWSVSSLKLVK